MIEHYTDPKKVVAKLKKQKFEVCFKRSMNAMKGGINEFSKDMPSMKRVGSKLKKMKMKKLYAWEKKLGEQAHDKDFQKHW